MGGGGAYNYLFMILLNFIYFEILKINICFVKLRICMYTIYVLALSIHCTILYLFHIIVDIIYNKPNDV